MKAGRVRSSRSSELVASAGVLALAAALGVIGRSVAAATASPERGVILSAALFSGAAIAVFLTWLAVRGWRLDVDVASFGVVCAALGVVVASWFAGHLGQTLFRADILIWSESPFVNDIIRFRAGLPLYGDPPDLSSFNYTPGAPLLTYGLASLAGLGESVPAMRVVQLLYVVVAVFLGIRAARRLSGFSAHAGGLPWTVLWTLLLFLAATNSLTNPFTHLLHNDALGLVVCAAAFLAIVEYAESERAGWLVAMVVIPPMGFLVKQSLGIWCVLFGAWLLFFGPRPRWLRAVLVGAGGLALTVGLYGGGLFLWGENFRYWVIEGLGKHAVSPLRAIQHGLDAWAYWAAGLWACLVLVRGDRARSLLGFWLVWLLLFAVETYTSGIAWMLNHMGPGSFIAAIWLAAALPTAWPVPVPGERWWSWFRAGLTTAIAILFVSGLRAIHLPVPVLPDDAQRYATAIEREFDGLAPDDVLLDHGSWLYLPANVVQRDRSAPAGEAGWTQTADFEGLLGRLRDRRYARILMREVDGPEFMYDYSLWPVSSGVRDALRANYVVVRTIPAVEGSEDTPWLRAISVLEPRQP